MAYALYFILLIGFCLLIPKMRFMTKSGIPVKWLVVLFLIRAAAGLANCYISYHFLEISDSLAFHNIALNEYHHLVTNPGYFFRETFVDYGNNYSGLLDTSYSFWNNLKTNVIVKTIAVLDVFTFRNFYVNTLVFNMVVFTGCVALFRAIRESVTCSPLLLAVAVFLFPSALFYTSGIHRDGLVLMGIGWITFSLQRIEQHGLSLKRLSAFALPLLLIFAIRNYLAFLLIPACIAWRLSARNRSWSAVIFTMIAMMCVLLFFVSKTFVPQADFPQYVINRLADFDDIARGSNTYAPVAGLTPDFYGFLKTLPVAVEHAFLRPAPWHISVRGEWPFALELLGVQILFVYNLIKSRKVAQPPIVCFIIFIAVFSLITIGYTVPNMGAIIRYRSVYLQLIFILLFYRLHTINRLESST